MTRQHFPQLATIQWGESAHQRRGLNRYSMWGFWVTLKYCQCFSLHILASLPRNNIHSNAFGLVWWDLLWTLFRGSLLLMLKLMRSDRAEMNGLSGLKAFLWHISNKNNHTVLRAQTRFSIKAIKFQGIRDFGLKELVDVVSMEAIPKIVSELRVQSRFGTQSDYDHSHHNNNKKNTSCQQSPDLSEHNITKWQKHTIRHTKLSYAISAFVWHQCYHQD